MPSVKRVGHLVINVRDQEVSTKFYTEVLGFDISLNREGFGTFLTCGKIHHDLALFQAAPDAAPVTSATLPASRMIGILSSRRVHSRWTTSADHRPI